MNPHILLSLVIAAALATAPTAAQTITGRPIPPPLYGITFDDVSNISREVTAVSNIVKVPTVRVVFDRGTNASYYKTPIQRLRPVSYIMGELIDSSYMRQFQTVAAVQSWTNSYVNTLGSLVDVWEIGNEVNGDWLGSNVMAKIEAMYDIVAGRGGRTALTFFYEGEPDQRNCIDSQGGMFPWISRNFAGDPESEKLRLGVNYVLISWYPTQCRGVNPDWATVYTKLAAFFPNSQVGFGEIGTPNPQGGSDKEKSLINTYYPMANTTPGLPPSYVGGYFWWYGAEEFVPWPGSLGDTLNAALSSGP